nr:flagellar biosynthetic protein FliO [Nocardioides flavescens]
MLCARVASRRFTGKHSSLVKVLHRQPISRNAAVSVVDVGGRVLVLGTTDQGVRLLTELDAATLPGEGRDDDGDGPDSGPGLSLVPTLAPASGEGPAETSQARLEESLLDAWTSTGTPAGPAPRAGRHSHRAARTPARGRRAGARRASGPTTPAAAAGAPGALTGSLLSPQTWLQAWAVVSRRAS